jgi:rhamnosyl/mannosyltransferase
VKVVHVYKDYPPVWGGIENHLRLLAEAQAAAGLEVTVVVTATDARTTTAFERGVRVVRAARLAAVASTPLSPSLLRSLRRLAATHPDVVHVHAPYPPGELGAALCAARATVVTYHSDIVRQRLLGRVYRPLQQRLLRGADRILVTSPRYLSTSTALAAHLERCQVVPLGIDPEPLLHADPAAAAAVRARFGGPLVLFVGRLRSYKGLDHLLAAMATLPGRAALVVAGSGPLERRWRQLAAPLVAAGRCHFLGEVPDGDLPALYAAADVFVLPSVERSEAFGVVLLEAMAAAVPVVSTELGTGTSWVNLDGETGRVVPPRDPPALASAIAELLAAPERGRALGLAGRRRVLTEFTAARMTARVIASYREVLTHRPPV